MKAFEPRIVIIGAGIVGASIAYHLARRGAAVAIVDKGLPAAGVTGKAFAWINISRGTSDPSSPLRRLAIPEWRRLEHDLQGALEVNWCGAISWYSNLAATERFARDHAASGYDVRLVGREEIAKLEPNLIEPPVCAAYAKSEGAVDPIAATGTLIQAARQAGAHVHLTRDVVALTTNGGRMTGVRTVTGAIEADIVIVAAGTGASKLCESLDVKLPINSSPALLLRFRTRERIVNKVISTPDIEVRQASDVLLLAAENYIDDSPENGPDVIARRALAVIKQQLRGSDGVELESVSVGMRPIPADGSPVVGFAPGVEGLYVAVLHAGVALAPVVGRLATTEILDDVDESLLQACRIERFMDRLN
jgi:glycine/D-amino acid oxidase-like deaminating enzyme